MSNTMKHSQSFSTRNEALAYLSGLRRLIPLLRDTCEIWFRTEAHDGIAADRWTVHMYSRPREGRRNVGHRLDA